MSKKLRIGVIGAGRIGKLHANNLVNRVPNAELVAVSDVYEPAAQALAEQLGIVAYNDYHKILEGQVWRLFTYIFTYQATSSNFLLVAISLFCFYSLGSAVEHTFGTLRFNLFYLTGILLMDTFAMCCGGIPVEFMGVSIDVNDLGVYTTMSDYLHLSLLIAFATLYPDTHFLLFFIIPVKAWIFGLLDIILTLYGVYEMLFLHALSPMLPHSLFPLVAIPVYYRIMKMLKK